MNKAFVREPDQTDEHCPRCGSLGQPVGRVTLAAHLSPAARQQLSEFASFCPFPQCEVAYFDAFERVVTTDALLRPLFPKDPDAPICGCFGLTRDDVEQDVAEGVATRVRELLAKAQSPAARCSEMAANGVSCVPDVQKYYLRCRGD